MFSDRAKDITGTEVAVISTFPEGTPPPSAVFPAFMRGANFSLAEAAGCDIAIPASDGATRCRPRTIQELEGAGAEECMQVVVHLPREVNSGIVRAALQNFVSRNSGLVVPIQGQDGTNALLIGDYAHVLRRMLAVVRDLTRASAFSAADFPAAQPASWATATPCAQAEVITKDVNIEELLLRAATGRRRAVLVSERALAFLRQTVRLMAPPTEGDKGIFAERQLRLALMLKNFALVAEGEWDTLVPVNEVVTKARILGPREYAELEPLGYTTVVVPVKHVNVGLVRTALQSLVTRNSGLVAPIQGPHWSALVVCDHAYRIAPIIATVRALDAPGVKTERVPGPYGFAALPEPALPDNADTGPALNDLARAWVASTGRMLMLSERSHVLMSKAAAASDTVDFSQAVRGQNFALATPGWGATLVPANEAPSWSAVWNIFSLASRGDHEVGIVILPLRRISASAARAELQTMVSPNAGVIVPIAGADRGPPENSVGQDFLVIADFADRLRHIVAEVQRVDGAQ